MHLKRYRSRTVRDALAQARAELGPEALVLSTRVVAEKGIKGWFGARVVEVTAAASRDVSENRPFASPFRQPAPDPEPVPVRRRGSPDDPLIARLTAAGLDQALVTAVVASLPRWQRRHASVSSLRRAIAAHLEDVAAGEETYQPAEVFVGPPGVGKTTTVAKIAAQARAREGLRIGLVAADGIRVGAIEQLRLYADIIGTPFFVARTPADLAHTLAAAPAPVLVDTPGRSTGDADAHALLALIGTRPGVRTHLVMAATATPREAARLLAAYAAARPSRVVLTRVDEAASLAPLVGLLRERGLPVSYLGTGQRVPEDLARATAPVLAALLVGDTAGEAGARA
jgi:flagellar biosynthesis protein FlhF